MPQILDATVVGQAYDTSGNGGRKMVRLNNGNLYFLTKVASGYNLYKSTDNLATLPTLFKSNTSYTSFQDACLETDGTNVYMLFAYNNTAVNIIGWKDDGTVVTSIAVESTAQTALGNVSMIRNGTELHATWASKNSTYVNSFNIRYAKGTINADGSVTWGAVEQVTRGNTSGYDFLNPSISFDKSGIPVIIVGSANVIFTTTEVFNKGIVVIKRDSSLSYKGTGSNYLASASWSVGTVYNSGGTSYVQSSPSAIFVPQSINGLPNGRIWVAWHGMDSTDTSQDNIRVSYSDDGGVTWSSMLKLTSGSTLSNRYASITANPNNEISIVWMAGNGTSNYYDIVKIKNTGGSWGSQVQVTNNTTQHAMYPSTLFDLTLNFSEPLFIYQNNQTAKVGFYGTWTTTVISVPQGNIGHVSDKNNLLSYNITSDGSMETVTEKINGVVVGTKTLASGEETTVSVSQELWDDVRFGKYADTTGGLNTLTIEMGTEKWTYPFEKILSADADMLSAVKAVKDANEVKFPAIKQMLVDKVGGDVADSFEGIIEGFDLGKKWASGITPVTGSSMAVSVSGLPFKPEIVITESSHGYRKVYLENSIITNANNYIYSGSTSAISRGEWTITDSGFSTLAHTGSGTYDINWLAIGKG